MAFPLKDWIDLHGDVPHHLSRSGVGETLGTVRSALRRPMEPDEDELRTDLARVHGVDVARIFLTHGATEASGLVLFYLAERFRRSRHRAPRCVVPSPEYPPLPDAAAAAGFRRVDIGHPADLAIYSDPNNPTGLSPGESGRRRLDRGCAAVLVDETFREFTATPSLTWKAGRGVWVGRSFSKAYGADALRVGYVVAPEEETERFEVFQSIVLDSLPLHSVAGVRALVRDRARILAEVRQRFRDNLRRLRQAVPSAPPLAAPVWFDRGSGRSDSDRFARRALRAGVLVCPGRFFGDPSGVRVCLTQASFPADLAAYLRVRAEWF